jgi:hypothetical protein
MTSSGLLIMIASVGSVTVLFAWCIWKVLTSPDQAESLHGVELHTPDMDAEE